MEAEYTGERRRRRIITLAGLLLAVVATGATYYLVTRPSGATPPAQRNVVVAATDIAARTTIAANMLRTEQVPDSLALANVLSDPASATNQVAAVAIKAGDLITPSMYGAGTASGIGILAPGETISPDSPIWRAVSLTVPADRAVAGMISQGDHVDLFVTLTPQLFDTSGGVPASFPAVIDDPDHSGPLTLGYYAASTTKLTWTNLQVLQVDSANSLYVIKVDEHQAEEIAHVQAIGATFTLGLRPSTDNRPVDRTSYGETTNKMIDDYGFPIPNMIQIPLELPSPKP